MSFFMPELPEDKRKWETEVKVNEDKAAIAIGLSIIESKDKEIAELKAKLEENMSREIDLTLTCKFGNAHEEHCGGCEAEAVDKESKLWAKDSCNLEQEIAELKAKLNDVKESDSHYRKMFKKLEEQIIDHLVKEQDFKSQLLESQGREMGLRVALEEMMDRWERSGGTKDAPCFENGVNAISSPPPAIGGLLDECEKTLIWGRDNGCDSNCPLHDDCTCGAKLFNDTIAKIREVRHGK